MNRLRYPALRAHSLAVLAALCLAPSAVAQDQDSATLELEVTVPNKAVMYVMNPGDSSARASTFSSEFDLRCATDTLSDDVRARCAALYPNDDDDKAGLLRDLQGRSYPPTETDARGDTVPGSFPQVFAARKNTLRVFMPSPSWSLSVTYEGPDNENQRPVPIDALAVAASIRPETGSGASTQQTCLAYNPAWKMLQPFKNMVCSENAPNAQLNPSGVPVARLADNPGGWHQVDLSLYLRLDGDETSGQYSGVLRYTLANF